MKQLFTICAAFIFFANVLAQAPDKMSYQAVIRNTSNILVTNQVVGMQISILQGSANGTPLYVETQSPTTNVNGLVSVEIGGGTVVSGSFASINWANGPYFIKTETDPAGGSSYSITGTSQLLSVPYALYAQTSGSSTPGPQGATGPTGADGAVGPTGATGADGVNGATGPQGPTGTPGSQDAWGLNGNAGTNSSTNFIGTTDAQDVVVKRNGVEIMRVTEGYSGGNLNEGLININTTTSHNHYNGNFSALSVNSSGPVPISIKRNWINCSYASINNTDTAYFGINVYGNVSIGHSANAAFNNLQIAPSGNVGIGTTNPNASLSFGSNGNQNKIVLWEPSNQLLTSQIGVGISPNNYQFYVGTNTNSFSFRQGGFNGSELMKLTGTGNLALGTTNPSGKFHINNDITGSDSVFIVKNSGYVGIGTLSPAKKLDVNGTDGNGIRISNTSSNIPFVLTNENDGRFVIKDDVSGGINMVLDKGNSLFNFNGANVCVGTVSPDVHNATQSRLSVSSTGPVPLSIKRNYINCSYAAINTVDTVFFGINNQGNVSIGHNVDAYYNSLQIASSGNVGIGEVAPQRALHVNDVMRLEPRATAPASPAQGDMYYDSTLNKLRVYDGTTWQNCW